MRTLILALLCCAALPAEGQLKAGVSAVAITPFGKHPDWKGPVSESGVWGDETHKIWLAGFGSNRPATGKHDDLWARALVLEAGKTKVALVALDFIGYYHEGGYYGGDHVKKMLSPSLGLTEVIIASTHNHEGPDTIGLWAPLGRDGKYKEYLEWVDRRIAEAVTQAATPANLAPVNVRIGVTDPKRSPSLTGLQVRTTHRPPFFFDDELRAMQLTRRDGKTLATLVNWNTHPESLESRNQEITSDFPHFVREAVEKKYGGAAVYFSGDIGAVEIIGDAESRTGQDYEVIDGKQFPLTAGHRPNVSFERTAAIGNAVATAVFQALDAGHNERIDSLTVKSLPVSTPVTNRGYIQAIKAKTLPNFSGDLDHPNVESTLYYLRAGPLDIITLPGEVFPELIHGVEVHKRTDCAEANTGRPYEPPVIPLLNGKYHFIIGLAPDELGYVVPGYDFWVKADGGRMQDACKDPKVPNHYHETNSSSSQMAPVIACGLVKLVGGDPAKYEACR